MPANTTMVTTAEKQPPAKSSTLISCPNCQECGTKVVVGGTPVRYWPVQLDTDLLQTVSSLFPNWFKDCNINSINEMTDNHSKAVGGVGGIKVPFIPLSPQTCEVDDTPLHGKSLNKNKESLKVKLMLRRPRHDLISRGVIPAVSTSYNFYEQRQKLDMAKKHDFLKQKIQRRPLREELVRQHILEDAPNNIDPSLVEKQKQLKRARIADTISDHLCQRPGPLELVKANILHTSEDLEKAVKEGQLVFKSTCEGEPRKHPSLYLIQEDESSSEGAMSPDQSEGGSGRASRESSVVPVTISATIALPTGTQFSAPSLIQATQSVSSIIFSAAPSPSFCHSFTSSSLSSLPSTVTIVSTNDIPAPSPLTSNTSSLSPLSSLASPCQPVMPSPQRPHLAPTLLVAQTPLPSALTTPPLQNSAPGKDQSKSRKKSKGKSQPKARTIKFHEYKGPPSAAKRDATPVETSYDILLQQQQLFLQCQLELKQKYPQIILPAGLKPTSADVSSGVTLSSVLTLAPAASPQPLTSHTPIAPAPVPGLCGISVSSVPPPPPPPPPTRSGISKLPTKLEELKVSDLKAELKKRNLPVSGSKPNLIERLKLHSKTAASLSNTTPNNVINKTNFIYNTNVLSNQNSDSVFESVIGGSSLAESDFSIGLFTPRSSVDFTDDASVSGMLEASMEVGEENIASPAYSQISTRPSSAAPMDVDFDTAMDVSGPLTPMTPLNSFAINSSEGGSINTPPPPPPPPPQSQTPVNTNRITIGTTENDILGNQFDLSASPNIVVHLPKQFMSPSEASELANQEDIVHLQKKIDDLQWKLRDTQLQLHLQQQQNMIKAQEVYKKSSCDSNKLSHKDIIQQQLDKRKQVQQQKQLQSHMQLLQQNLQKEQKQLAKNVLDDTSRINCLDDLLILHPDNHNETAIMERQCPQQYAIVSEHQEEKLTMQHQVPMQPLFSIGDVQVKVENDWLPITTSIPPEDHRSSSVATPNGYIISTHHRTASLPNFSGRNSPEDHSNNVFEENNCNLDMNRLNNNINDHLNCFQNIINNESAVKLATNSELGMKPPPNYNEATKGFKEHHLQNPYGKTSYKSQQVDDVLEILIKNGELPPSAADDPPTPTLTQRAMEPPIFNSIPHVEMSRLKEHPPPPPPPPPPPRPPPPRFLPQSSTPITSQQPLPLLNTNFVTFSSPSIFADLVMEGNSPAHIDLNLDLELPVLGGLELNSLENHASEGIVGLNLPRKQNNPSLHEIKMEVGEDLDVSSWIDSLARTPMQPLTQAPAVPSWIKLGQESPASTPHNAACSGVNSMRSSSSASSSTSSSGYGSTFHQSDPLLGSNTDQLDFFSIEDIDLKGPSQSAHDLSWERLDFTT